MLVIVTITKFTHGAWVVLIILPAIAFILLRIRNHYVHVYRELAQHLGQMQGYRDVVDTSVFVKFHLKDAEEDPRGLNGTKVLSWTTT